MKIRTNGRRNITYSSNCTSLNRECKHVFLCRTAYKCIEHFWSYQTFQVTVKIEFFSSLPYAHQHYTVTSYNIGFCCKNNHQRMRKYCFKNMLIWYYMLIITLENNVIFSQFTIWSVTTYALSCVNDRRGDFKQYFIDVSYVIATARLKRFWYGTAASVTSVYPSQSHCVFIMSSCKINIIPCTLTVKYLGMTIVNKLNFIKNTEIAMKKCISRGKHFWSITYKNMGICKKTAVHIQKCLDLNSSMAI